MHFTLLLHGKSRETEAQGHPVNFCVSQVWNHILIGPDWFLNVSPLLVSDISLWNLPFCVIDTCSLIISVPYKLGLFLTFFPGDEGFFA